MVQFKLTFKIKRLCWSQLKEALQSIYLQNNRLVTLPERIFTRNMQGLKTVMLQENQWACNCSIYWLATWVPRPKNRPNNFSSNNLKMKKISWIQNTANDDNQMCTKTTCPTCNSPKKWLSSNITSIATSYTALYCKVKQISGKFKISKFRRDVYTQSVSFFGQIVTLADKLIWHMQHSFRLFDCFWTWHDTYKVHL